MMKQFFKNLIDNVEGNALMLFGAALVPMIIMIGSGVDTSITYMARNKLQNACDAGVLAGRLAMVGTNWNADADAEAHKFFNFNFPVGTHDVADPSFAVTQDSTDRTQLLGHATGTVPTTMMFIFGFDTMDISVNCDAKRDMGHNDVMLVLDVTASMLSQPSTGGGVPKVNLLREATGGLYRALQGASGGSRTRYGFMPFSQTVNVARHLANNDIVKDQYMVDLDPVCTVVDEVTTCTNQYSRMKLVNALDSFYNNGGNGSATENAIIQGFRTGGNGCIEERPKFGNSYNDGEFVIGTEVTLSDINEAPRNGNDDDRQFGRYEPQRQEGYIWAVCNSEAKQFATYATEDDFRVAVDEATARVDGGTVADIGMLWGVRFASRDGLLKANNPKTYNGWPVNPHIVFFTDGQMYVTGDHYTAYGVERYTHRVEGDGIGAERYVPYPTLVAKHSERFRNICRLAKSMGMTIWVVALDTARNPDYVGCASSASHYFESDGTDLEDKFTQIGQGIGNLRLTR